jgi:PTH1 family peptidyl-tRNA hydrolase
MFGMFKNKKEKTKFLVVGLGNPGSKYEYTRHNAGFMVLDYIAKILKIKINVSKFKSLFSAAKIGKEDVILLKPKTFMNLSGESVFECMQYYNISPERLIVIFDDVSLDIGTIRIRRSGSSGGHNGVKSIINLIGTDNFPRIKIGVGEKPDRWDLPSWVLSRFSESELNNVISCAERSMSALELILRGKIDEAMNKFN